jgi:hypothetical protein
VKENNWSCYHTDLICNNKFQNPKTITTTFPHFKETPTFSCLIHLHCYANIDLKEGERKKESCEVVANEMLQVGTNATHASIYFVLGTHVS